MNKKGSMELSVNSIVILIIAVVMMGLILGFIQTKFKNVGRDFAKNEPNAPMATASEPMTVSRSEVVVSPNEEMVLKVRIYNLGDAFGGQNPITQISPVFDAGGTPACSPSGLQLTMTALPADIPYGASVEFNTVTSVSGAQPGKYICRLSTDQYYTYPALSKEIVVTIE
ncbi:MAG: hypothetical protein ACP5OA_02940 [Candidatus Woesearchaeota archaeon]